MQLHSVTSDAGLGLINITIPGVDTAGISMQRPAGNYTYIVRSHSEETIVSVKVIGEISLVTIIHFELSKAYR